MRIIAFIEPTPPLSEFLFLAAKSCLCGHFSMCYFKIGYAVLKEMEQEYELITYSFQLTTQTITNVCLHRRDLKKNLNVL